MCHGLHCIADSSWPINFWTNRCVGLLCNALPTSNVFSSLTLAETLLLPLHHKGPTGTGAVDPAICKARQVVQQLNRNFCFSKKISWERGYQLAMKSVLNTPFLLGTLRMDPNEVLWQEPNLDTPFDVVSPNDLHTSVYTSRPTQGMQVSCRFYMLVCAF